MGMLYFAIGVITGLIIASVIFLVVDYQHTKAVNKQLNERVR